MAVQVKLDQFEKKPICNSTCSLTSGDTTYSTISEESSVFSNDVDGFVLRIPTLNFSLIGSCMIKS